MPCPSAVANAPYREFTVNSGDTAWGYYVSVLKDRRGARWRDFRAPTDGADDRSDDFLDSFRDLNPGTNVEALVVGTKVKVPTNPRTAKQASGLVVYVTRCD